MEVVEFIAGVAVGTVVGVVLKDKIIPNPLEKEVVKLKRELSDSTNRSKHLKEQINNLESTVTSQNSELKSLRREVYNKEDSLEDEKDEVVALRKKNSQIVSENEDLRRQLNELNQLYTARKQELHTLQDKFEDLKRKS